MSSTTTFIHKYWLWRVINSLLINYGTYLGFLVITNQFNMLKYVFNLRKIGKSGKNTK